MKKSRLKIGVFAILCMLLVGISIADSNPSEITTPTPNSSEITTPIPNPKKSLKAFKTILKVITSPRCINCHPTDDRPRQGDDHHPHLFGVERGPDNQGLTVQKCATCHHEENNPYTNVPGAPNWGLAPKSMGWLGLSDAEIGKRLLDTTRNGNRSPEDLVHHMSHDKLVLWAWEPGEGRTLPPVEFEDFKKALKTWLDNGAHIQ